MQWYTAKAADCQSITPDLEPAPEDKDFNKIRLAKLPEGEMPEGHLRRLCDGHYMGYKSLAGSRLKLGGVDWGLFLMAGAIVFTFALNVFAEGINSIIPWKNTEYGNFILWVWGAFFLFLFIGLWVRKLAKKDGYSYIALSREHGTVAFPKVANHEALTVSFDDVELSVVRTMHTRGTHLWHITIRTKTCRPGGKPRKEGLNLNGNTKDDFQREWNMICRFMDKSLSLPECLHAVIANYQSQRVDIWGDPLTREQIIDPPLKVDI